MEQTDGEQVEHKFIAAHTFPRGFDALCFATDRKNAARFLHLFQAELK